MKASGFAADTVEVMRKRLIAAVAALSVLAVPASSLGGGDGPASADSVNRGLGGIVAKDTAKQHPESAAARKKLTDFGKVSWQVTSKPSGLSVEYAFIVRCNKGFLFDYFPGPGDVRTTKRTTPFSGSYPIPLADPDLCDFQVAGQIPGESEKRGRVTVRIFDKG